MNKENETYRRVETFFGKMLGRHEIIHIETDFTLEDTAGKGILYYPESFKKVIQTAAVKRMARIFQLGTKIYTYPNVVHTRIEHSKGTYYRTLELLQILYENENIKKMIHEKGYEKYVLATLARALLHDIGHGPFSHTIETVCDLPKGFHEEIGKRLIKENPELREALDGIYPGLSKLIEEVKEKNFLGLNRIFEGQADLDRGDFGPRDSFFANANFKENSRVASELFSSITITKVKDGNGDTMIIPVFAANQIGNLDLFFTNRFNNYKNIYYNPKCSSYDYVFKAFAERLLQCEEYYKLKEFLSNNTGKKPEEIDLEEYIQFNDVEFLKRIMEVAEKTKDPILRKLAMMSLPTKSKAKDIYYGLMISEEQVDEDGYRAYTNESDEEFIRRLEQLPDSDTEYEQNCLTLNNNSSQNINEVIQRIKLSLGIDAEDLEKLGIFSWNYRLSLYKNKLGEETYIYGENGEIYEYSAHPGRRVELQQEDVPGFCILIPILEANGYEKEKIDEVRKIIEENNKQFQTDEPCQ